MQHADGAIQKDQHIQLLRHRWWLDSWNKHLALEARTTLQHADADCINTFSSRSLVARQVEQSTLVPGASPSDAALHTALLLCDPPRWMHR